MCRFIDRGEDVFEVAGWAGFACFLVDELDDAVFYVCSKVLISWT